MNYRLGAFGWFALETANLYGNYGAADIIQALEWIQENIAAFGGDPVRLDPSDILRLIISPCSKR